MFTSASKIELILHRVAVTVVRQRTEGTLSNFKFVREKDSGNH